MAVSTAILIGSTGCATRIQPGHTGPWDLQALSEVPSFSWGQKTGLVQEVFYEGEPFNGQPTRVFGYLGRPVDSSNKPHPAVVLVHGGGGKAFKDWAEHWAKRGYVALAMDLSGNGPSGRLPDGGPDQSDSSKFRDFGLADGPNMWTYHAVAAVVRGNSLLRSLTEVDRARIGITGISWGGYLTCIVAGIDPRFKAAVPVYGCGYLGENSVWTESSLARMNPSARSLWLELFDPSRYLGQVRRPILFVNGTTDFAYPLDSYQRSYRLVPERWRHISVAVNRPHGHIWTFPEVDAFIDGVLLRHRTLPRVGEPRLMNGELMVSVIGSTQFTEVLLCYTSGTGPWQKRTWTTLPAQQKGRKLSAELPLDRPLVAFLAMKDASGRHMSSEHVELPASNRSIHDP